MTSAVVAFNSSIWEAADGGSARVKPSGGRGWGADSHCLSTALNFEVKDKCIHAVT